MRADVVPMTRDRAERGDRTANEPTPPPAAWTSTGCRSRTPARWIDWKVVSPVSGTAAASSKESDERLACEGPDGRRDESANVPPCTQSLRTYP